MTPPITTKATAILSNLRLRPAASAQGPEQLFLKAAIALSSARRETVFEDLIHSLVELLDVDVGMIGVLGSGDRARRVSALAMWADGAWVDQYCYDLAGSPCETVVGKEFRFYERGVHDLFASDPDMKTFGIEGYAAFPLVGTDGSSLGLLAVMTHTPMQHPERIEALLRIFSDRAVVEIERARTESALKASEELYASVFNAALDGLAMLTLDHTIVDANPALLRMSGYSRDELIGRSILDFVHERAPARAFYAEVERAGRACDEGVTARKDGTPLICEYRAVLVHFRGRPHILQMVRDITERKEADDRRAALEEQLRHAQRMEAIGQLTGGIAHDFNNILTGLLGYVEVAQEHAERYHDEKLDRYLHRARGAGARARELVQQMLTFSRGKRGNPRPIDLAQVTREMMSLLDSTLPASVEVSTVLPPKLPATVLDPLHFEQVLMNLCINSRDAMNGVGRLTIELAERHCTECFCCASCRQPLDGAFVELSITDTGPGIPPDVQRRMFEPFFSTKESSKGSGMGLAIVHGIVHEYGGHLSVKSELGRGTTIRVVFPCEKTALTEPAVAAARADGNATRRQLHGRALVVEDDRDVRDFVRELLTGWGLEVIAYDDGLTAAREFAAHPGDFDFALLDQTMPHVTGIELSQTLLRQDPRLPIVLYTGYSDQVSEESVRAAGIRSLLKKPLDIPQLRRLVESLLPATETLR